MRLPENNKEQLLNFAGGSWRCSLCGSNAKIIWVRKKMRCECAQAQLLRKTKQLAEKNNGR